MIGLLDYDYCSSNFIKDLIPNLEIMKIAEYYRIEKSQFCRLLSLNESELSSYDKIYFFSEKDTIPIVPQSFLRAKNVIYGGTAFTNGVYQPFTEELIDYTLPKPNIYKESLKQKYSEGVKAKTIASVLDNTYYRCYAGKEQLPIPPIITNKRVYLYDRDFFYSNWQEILNKIVERKPSTIIRIHPIVCKTITNFFEAKNFPKMNQNNDFILDLDIPLEEVYFMLNKYKNYLLAEILPNSSVYIPLGNNKFSTSFQYFKDFIYKMNLLYCFWSYKIPIKIKSISSFVGYNNPLKNLSQKIQIWSDITKARHINKTINDSIARKQKNEWQKEKELLLKFYPQAKDLFDQKYSEVSKRGRWRI